MVFDILLTIILVLLNGFFVAAEFSIVKVRYSQIQLKAESGDRLAKTAQQIISKLDAYLSATQLGITLASLGLGWIGEPVVAKIIKEVTVLLGIQITEHTLHAISLPTGFLLITTLHIVFGELAPKSVAIRKPEDTTLFVALPLQLFFKVFQPFIWLMNSFSNAFLKFIGIEPANEHDIHSTEELQLLVKQSKEGGKIEEEDYEIIKNAFDFTDHNAKQIMVPRQHVFALDKKTPMKEIVERLLENGYSRVPIYDDSLDNIIGIAHTKEVVRQFFKNPALKIEAVLQDVFYVIGTRRISDVLRDFQKKHTHFAVIMDEFGGTAGIITLEDILEELVGDIQDENDEELQVVVRTSKENVYKVQATYSLEDINELLPRPFEVSDDYNTLSGFILHTKQEIPKVNQILHLEDYGYEIKISVMERRSVKEVLITDEWHEKNITAVDNTDKAPVSEDNIV